MGIAFSFARMTPRNVWDMYRQSYFLGEPGWTERDMPDLEGQVAIVTGANAGLGKETARALLEHNATVYMACRSRAKAQDAIAELLRVTGKEAIFLECDLSSLSSIKAAAEQFLSKQSRLHILYNNGGVMVPPIELVTPEGYDLTFGTNVLGHFYLTKLLLPSLEAAAASTPGTGRVLNLTSMIHYAAVINYASFKDGPVRRKSHPSDLYAQSKWGTAVFSVELARRYADRGIVSVSINPGNLRTDLAKDATGMARLGTNILMIRPVKWGVLSQLWAGTSEEGAQLNGKYVSPWATVNYARADVDDPQSGSELWAWLEEQVARASLS